MDGVASEGAQLYTLPWAPFEMGPALDGHDHPRWTAGITTPNGQHFLIFSSKLNMTMFSIYGIC